MRRFRVFIILWAVLFSCVAIEQSYSATVYHRYEWVLEPTINGSVHIAWTVTLCCEEEVFSTTWGKGRPIKDVKAKDAKTGESLQATLVDEGDRLKLQIELGEKGRSGYQVVIELDRLYSVKEEDEAYYFDFGYSGAIEHTITVILPTGHEFLYAQYLDVEKVTTAANRVSVLFEQVSHEKEQFDVGVWFSHRGIQLLEKAEIDFLNGQYSDAEKAYEDAVNFYSQISTLYNRNKDEFLAHLHGKAAECKSLAEEERIQKTTQLAEEKFTEAVAAFHGGDYESAKALFTEAQNKYNSVNDSAKVSECRDYIDTCTQYMEQAQSRAEAEALFSEGVIYFEQEQYEEAKTTFEEALIIFTELGDEEKAEECTERIASCEEAGKGSCLGTVLISLIVMWGSVCAGKKTGK
jgi:tetratricopeptide (TPR) repeat protein